MYTREFKSCVILKALRLEGDDQRASPPVSRYPRHEQSSRFLTTQADTDHLPVLAYILQTLVAAAGEFSKVRQCHQEGIELLSKRITARGRVCVWALN